MNLAQITNRDNTVRVDFNDLSPSFGNSFTIIPKAGTSLVLGYPVTSFKVIYMQGLEVIEISDKESGYFINPVTSLPFINAKEMAEYLDTLIN